MKLNYKVIAIGISLVLAFIAVYEKGINDGQKKVAQMIFWAT